MGPATVSPPHEPQLKLGRRDDACEAPLGAQLCLAARGSVTDGASGQHMLADLFAAFLCELSDWLRSIVGIGPAMVNPRFADVVQRYFGKDATLKIQAMVTVFGGRENQFGLGDVSTI